MHCEKHRIKKHFKHFQTDTCEYNREFLKRFRKKY